MEHEKRPVGITVLGALVVLAGVVVFLAGIGAMVAGLLGFIGVPLPPGELLLGGVLYLVLGVILFVSGGGLLRLRGWAWWLAFLATLVGFGVSAFRIATEGLLVVTSGTVIAAVVLPVILVYLLVVRRHFGRPRPPTEAAHEAA